VWGFGRQCGAAAVEVVGQGGAFGAVQVARSACGMQRFVEAGEQKLHRLRLHELLAKQPDRLGVRDLVAKPQPEEAHERQSVADLKRLYSRFDPSKETVVYCQSGVRASETAGVLQELGFTKVKVYDSSWLGYGNTLDAPANNVTFFNVGLFNTRLSTLQNRVNQLEKELADAKARK